MKKVTFSLIILFCSTFSLFAQNEDTSQAQKSDQNLKDLQGVLDTLQAKIANITNSIDSVDLDQVEKITDEIEKITDKIEDELDKMEDKIDSRKDKEDVGDTDDTDIISFGSEKNINKSPSEDKNNRDSKKMHCPRRTKFYVSFDFGLNGLENNNKQTVENINYPTFETWKSWFYEFGAKFRTRLGGQNSPISLHYGLTYRANQFVPSSSYQLVWNDAHTYSTFQNSSVSNSDIKLNVGYLTLPLQLRCKIGKKGTIGAGGYVGYRVLTNQYIKYKLNSEKITESRADGYGLSNFMYGLNASLGMNNIHLVAKYDLSNLFNKDNTNYVYNIYNFGLAINL